MNHQPDQIHFNPPLILSNFAVERGGCVHRIPIVPFIVYFSLKGVKCPF